MPKYSSNILKHRCAQFSGFLMRLQTKMYSYATILFYLALAELFRRCCIALIAAFTGPLARVPGPFLHKFTTLPWMFENLAGNTMNVAPKLFKKYGDTVRVCKYDAVMDG
jgi:hypothetical protein